MLHRSLAAAIGTIENAPFPVRSETTTNINMRQCYWVAGSAGLILIMTVPTTEEYESRTAELLGENHLVKSYRTIVVLDRVKVDLSLPL
ncbi:Lrp/AsnC ligand binding domain-containing protein [Pseudochrobactrum sp. sp1633]|uniref:Lrp/AsnC ligand binding domain-containing protein n=1 Tax=Pseudochrobactrum sp. sp1633 TaxID=3036706 RepID=UPI0035B500DA